MLASVSQDKPFIDGQQEDKLIQYLREDEKYESRNYVVDF